MNEWSFQPGKRKYLLLADAKGLSSIQPLIQAIAEEHKPFELRYVPDQQEWTDLADWLSGQKMGTYLYAAGEWNFIEKVIGLAEQAGFSEEERQLQGIGRKPIRLFCCRCHGLSDVPPGEQEVWRVIACKHCGLDLSVSDHYSRRLEAYLGYPAHL